MMIVDRLDRQSDIRHDFFLAPGSRHNAIQKGAAAFKLRVYESSSEVAPRCQREKPKTPYTTVDKRYPQSRTVCLRTTYQGKN